MHPSPCAGRNGKNFTINPTYCESFHPFDYLILVTISKQRISQIGRAGLECTSFMAGHLNIKICIDFVPIITHELSTDPLMR